MKISEIVNSIPHNEKERLDALYKYEILYTPAEEAFNNITEMMAQVFGAPMAFISLVDRDKVYYKAQTGPFGRDRVERVDSLCSLTILGSEPLIIEDASGESCFIDNPYVAVEGGIKFYAGAPLITKEGHRIGTACIVDVTPRKFSEMEKQLLVRFSRMVMHDIEVRLAARKNAEDITEEVAIRKRLEKAKESLISVLEALPEKGWTANNRGEANYLTKGWYEYTGQALGEAEGSGWAAAIHPDDVEGLVNKWLETVKTGKVLHEEARIRNKEGEYRWHLVRSVPIQDASGAITLWGGTCTDIHDRKLKTDDLEKKVRERTFELERSNKSLEEFAHAASHDLKEPLRKVNYFTDRLKNVLLPSLTDDQSRIFHRIEQALQRMGSLIDDLLDYSRVSELPRELALVDLNQTVQKVLEDLEVPIAEKKADVIIENLPEVKGNERQLQQLFQNLVGNALKYSKSDVRPEIKVSSRLVLGKEVHSNLTEERNEKRYFLIEVCDNGIGFHQKDAERIFQMFQRLHGSMEYKGTGVGLSIAKKIVENHEGFIWAESQPGKGAAFKILLPV